ELKRSKSLSALEQGERSIRIDCYIWKPRAAISSHAIATEEVTANINMFVHERDTRVGPDAGGRGREVVSSRGCRSRSGCTRIDAIAEPADYAEDFKVAKTRLSRGFENKVG